MLQWNACRLLECVFFFLCVDIPQRKKHKAICSLHVTIQNRSGFVFLADSLLQAAAALHVCLGLYYYRLYRQSNIRKVDIFMIHVKKKTNHISREWNNQSAEESQYTPG